MAIKLSKEAEERLITLIKRFFAETMEEEIGKKKIKIKRFLS
jgi:hypothetical protein